ncbi:Mur ligase [Schizophyllum amplum]|uniref:Folylpolyglutamate synthase n=1 Tax=Schizophyllum amplum TaxID=97359 RepID=A0A550CS90_9AGAR|nr:Mur ligase [Auriculariopsis ampla]
MSTRTYRDAVDCLNSLQSNAATLEAVRASGGRLSEFAIPEMVEYLERIGYSTTDLNALNVIHITGTKGKGSTSAFTNSILREAAPQWKVGLYTSPHLVAVRERIRVNGQPLSEEDFTKYFFEVWDALETNAERKLPSTTVLPGYFRFVTLMAYHAFLQMKVDATILEVGVGGMYDSTNIVPKPVVTGVTALGIDHVAVLGNTLRDIAWQKGGIYKEGVPALTVNQPPDGMEVLEQRAQELKASSFTVIPPLLPGLSSVKLGLAGSHQLQNASLATHLAHELLAAKGIIPRESELLSPPVVRGLQNARWPGRCQTVKDPKHPVTWYLDGAHTLESLDCCMQWYASPGTGLTSAPETDPETELPESGLLLSLARRWRIPGWIVPVKPSRVLIFNCTSGRAGPSFLGAVLAKVAAQLQLHGRETESAATFFDQVIFCANVTYADGGFKGDLTTKAIPESDLAELKTQQQLASAWQELAPDFPSERIHVLPSIEHAVKIVRTSGATQVLVTGSLHLVGGVIEVAGLSDVAL